MESVADPGQPSGRAEPLEQVVLGTLDVDLQDIDGGEVELLEHPDDVADPRRRPARTAPASVDGGAGTIAGEHGGAVRRADAVRQDRDLGIRPQRVGGLRGRAGTRLERIHRAPVPFGHPRRPAADVGAEVHRDTALGDGRIGEQVGIGRDRVHEVVHRPAVELGLEELAGEAARGHGSGAAGTRCVA